MKKHCTVSCQIQNMIQTQLGRNFSLADYSRTVWKATKALNIKDVDFTGSRYWYSNMANQQPEIINRCLTGKPKLKKSLSVETWVDRTRKRGDKMEKDMLLTLLEYHASTLLACFCHQRKHKCLTVCASSQTTDQLKSWKKRITGSWVKGAWKTWVYCWQPISWNRKWNMDLWIWNKVETKEADLICDCMLVGSQT